MDLRSLIGKYSQSGPRYTSYPTAPNWNEATREEAYKEALAGVGRKAADQATAVYIHIPFCENLCYYCGCNIQITKDHSRSRSYLESLKAEIAIAAAAIGRRVALSQVSLGGGTPTFFSPEEIEELWNALRSHFDLEPGAEVSIEIDPRVTTEAHMQTLARLGFNRVSLGVQDFDPKVQKAIHREQTAKQTADILNSAKAKGFRGINFDLIYGLPYQGLAQFSDTIDQVVAMAPDRIALYNYARLPAMIPHQKIIDALPMPDAAERVEIFLKAYDALVGNGYRAIGMDHFARADDELASAIDQGTLYRNFMGYTVKREGDLLGFGCSAIGEVSGGFFQNERSAKVYEDQIAKGQLATFRGCVMSPDDLQRKWIIQSLMCGFELLPAKFQAVFQLDLKTEFAAEWALLKGFEQDGLLAPTKDGYRVTDMGRLFIRNIAMTFDAYLKTPQKVKFSSTV